MVTSVPNNPLSLMNQWRRDIERAFEGVEEDGSRGEITAAAWAPAVDIKEEDGAYLVHADVPGVDPKDIDLNMENSVLTLRGERRLETAKEAGNYRHIERITGTFYRRFTLPDTADAEHISAKYSNRRLGVLGRAAVQGVTREPHAVLKNDRLQHTLRTFQFRDSLLAYMALSAK